MSWRLVDSGLKEPVFTVAADEAMAFARSKDLVQDTLHLYMRNKPTVSLGYFQKVNEALDIEFCKANDVSIVRRMTGGSAIYTDENQLIYGLVTSEDPRDKAFATVCSALIRSLAILGIEAEHKPPNDVLVGCRKISGSARMNRWGIVLRHGTLILRKKPEMMAAALNMDMVKIAGRGLEKSTYVTSVEESLGQMPDLSIVKQAVVQGFSEEFGVGFEKSEFSDYEKTMITDLINSKYGKDEWNYRF